MTNDRRCPQCNTKPGRVDTVMPWVFPAWKCTNPSHLGWQMIHMVELRIPPEHAATVGYRNTEYYRAKQASVQAAVMGKQHGAEVSKGSRSKSRRKG